MESKGHRFTNRRTGSEIQFEPARFSKNQKWHETVIQRSKSSFEECNLKVFDRPNSFLISKLARNSEIGPKMARQKSEIGSKFVRKFRTSIYVLDKIWPLRGNIYLDIQIFRAIFGRISLFRASFDIKNEFGRSKTFRLHPSKLDFDLPETVLGGCPGIGLRVSRMPRPQELVYI